MFLVNRGNGEMGDIRHPKEPEKKIKTQPTRKKKKKVNPKLVIFSFIMTIFLTGIILAGFMVVVLAKNYEIDESKLEMREASSIYDNKGEVVGNLYKENRKYIPIQEIDPLLQAAFIAVEDQRFYEHQGIDLKSIARALYRDILARSKVEGGSTITQQLAKNVFLTNEKKWLRKTEEVLIAIKLERKYSKDAILEMYLNYIYFGHGAHGIEAASKVYFGKSASELKLEEMAMLAALPKAPNAYSPLKAGNEEKSEQRRELVLRLMEEQGKITPEERERAANAELQLNREGAAKNPALDTYVDMVLEEAEERYGISSDEILIGGYEIHTALDLKAQEAMYEALNAESEVSKELFPEPGPEQIVQGSMVIMDHSSGGVVAVMGGRDYVRRGTNRATSEARQPGSTFKPIVSYAPALDAGWHPYDTVKDERIDYGGYKPKNYDGKYRGNVTMMEALQFSYNAPAVWLLNEIGIDKGRNYAKLFGFEEPKRELGIALGDIGASPLGMAKAYSAFANQGIMMEPYLIEKIIDRRGDHIAKKDVNFQQVVTPQTSWYMTKMLEKVVKEGTGKRAQLAHPVAGKTGTTQAPKGHKGVRDAWFVGYTPYYTAAVWMGFDKSNQDHVMETTGGNHPAKVFKYVMEKALEGKEIKPFEMPSGVEDLQPLAKLDPIHDLRAFVTLYSDLTLSVDLQFTPSTDDRVGYTILKTDLDTGEKIVLAEKVTRDRLVNGNGWVDRDIQLLGNYQYQIVLVNLKTGQEGAASNIVTVEVSPNAPYFRTEGQLDPTEYSDWLDDLVDQFNQDLDEEEVPEEENPTEEKPSNEDQPTQEKKKPDNPSGGGTGTPPNQDQGTPTDPPTGPINDPIIIPEPTGIVPPKNQGREILKV